MTTKYPQYPLPGQGPAPVHGGVAPYDPNQAAPPGYPQGPPPQQTPPQAAPQMPPQAAPPQGAYPQGPPPAPVYQGGVSPQAEAMAQAMERALGQANTRETDVKFFRPKKPQNFGQNVGSAIRVLPSWTGDDAAAYWWMVWRHFVWIELDDGRRLRLPRVCAEKMAPPGDPARCAICDRGKRAEAAGDQNTAKALEPRARFYMNILDLENLQEHYIQNKETGIWEAVAQVWDASQSAFRKLGQIIGTKGLVYDRNQGRNLMLYATKTGTEARDVRYEVIDQSEPCGLPQGFEEVRLIDLSQLDLPKDYMEQAKEIEKTYPDPAGVPMGTAQPPAGPPQAQPPYGNPYAAQGQQAPPQAPQMPPQAAPPPFNGMPPQAQAAPPPQAPPPQAAPPPPAAPPGWKLENGQWVPDPATAPPQAAVTAAPPQQGVAPTQNPPVPGAPGAAPGEGDPPF